MKYADVRVGDRVLVGQSRVGSPSWNVGNCNMATVLEVGVPHEYLVMGSGWDAWPERRTTDKGVRLSVTGQLSGKVSEQVTIAAKIVPASGDDLRRWEELQKIHRERDAARTARKQRLDELASRLADQGVEVKEWRGTSAVLAVDAVEKILWRLEQ